MNDSIRKKLKEHCPSSKKVNMSGTLILCQYIIALSSLAEAPTSWSILNCTMVARKPAYPIATQRYPKTYATKNNGLFCQNVVIIKCKPKRIQAKKHKMIPVTMIL